MKKMHSTDPMQIKWNFSVNSSYTVNPRDGFRYPLLFNFHISGLIELLNKEDIRISEDDCEYSMTYKVWDEVKTANMPLYFDLPDEVDKLKYVLRTDKEQGLEILLEDFEEREDLHDTIMNIKQRIDCQINFTGTYEGAAILPKIKDIIEKYYTQED